MSFILDALKKADRSRRLAGVPTLQTAHRSKATSRRRLWPWLLAGAALVNAAVVIVLLRATPSAVTLAPATRGETVVATTPGPALEPEPAASRALADIEAEATAEVPVTVPSSPRSAGQNLATGNPALDRATGGEPADRAASIAAPRPEPREVQPPVVKPPVRQELPSRPAPARPTGDTGGVAKGVLPPAGATPSPKPTQEKPVAGDVAGQAASAVPQPKPSGLAPPPDSVRPQTAKPKEPVTSPVEPIPKMRLDVLVYSDIAAERLVFINGQKYVEGQKIDGKFLVEGITAEGAVLSYQGQRQLLSR